MGCRICKSGGFLLPFANAVTCGKLGDFRLVTGVPPTGVEGSWVIFAASRKTTLFTKLLGLVTCHTGRGSHLRWRDVRPWGEIDSLY
jgi:hypothetical protein